MEINYEVYVSEAARAVNLSLQLASLPAIVASFCMLESMAQQVMAFPLDSHIEPASVFAP